MIACRRRAAAAAALLALVAWLLPAAQPGAAQGDEAVRRLLLEAEQLEQDGDREGALEKLALLSEQFPEAPEAAEALLRLATGHRELGRDEAAEEAARALITGHPRSLQAAGGYTLLGRLQLQRAESAEQLDEARSTLENAVLLFPRAAFHRQPWRAEAVVLGARLARRQGDDVAAAKALADVIDLEPRSRWTAEARFELAILLLDRGEWRQAAELLQEVLDDTGEDLDQQALAGLAASRLALIHRLELRPEAGGERWRSARLVSAAPERPVAVAARADGWVAVSGAKGATVVLDGAGEVVSRWSHEEPQHTSWNGAELVVATQEAAATFPERRNLRFASPPSEKKPTVRGLMAVEALPFGRWAVLAAKPSRVALYEPGRRLHEMLVDGKGVEPVDLAGDPAGRLLVLDAKTRSVSRFVDGNGGGQPLIRGGWERAGALSVDALGNVYVLDGGRRVVEMYDRHGERRAGLGPTLPGGLELDRPSDLAVDAAGRLWIADTRLGLVVLE